MKKGNILITGASGFIGSHLQRRFEKLRYKVDTYDLESGQDILDISSLEPAVCRKYDFIYHLAGFSGSKRSNEEVTRSFEVNTISTANILSLILRYSRNTKLILSGSRLEYGIPKYLPVDENHPTRPNSAYGLSKLASSQIALAFAKSNGLKTTIFRTSNVYGPHPKLRFKGYNVINYFIDLALRKKEIEIFGLGKQLRDYIYIDDLIDAFVGAIEKKSDGEVFNLGYGQPITLKEMATIIVKTVGKGKIISKPWPLEFKAVETGDYVSDISKISNCLSFKPKIDFETGVRLTYNNKS